MGCSTRAQISKCSGCASAGTDVTADLFTATLAWESHTRCILASLIKCHKPAGTTGQTLGIAEMAVCSPPTWGPRWGHVRNGLFPAHQCTLASRGLVKVGINFISLEASLIHSRGWAQPGRRSKGSSAPPQPPCPPWAEPGWSRKEDLAHSPCSRDHGLLENPTASVFFVLDADFSLSQDMTRLFVTAKLRACPARDRNAWEHQHRTVL